MSYIDQSDYKSLLNKFAQGTQKQKLQENYVDLKPINTFEGAITSFAPAYKEYDNMRSMEEAGGVGMNSVKNGFDKNPKVTKADFIPAKKNEGLYGDGPHATGYQLENLSLEEKKELKDYVDSIKITKKAIQELLAKAKAPKMEGGDTTGKDLNLASDEPTQTPEQPAANITPGGRHAAKVAAMGTKPHQGPNVGPKGFDY